MRVAKLIKENWPIVTVSIIESLITNVPEYKAKRVYTKELICLHCYVFLSDESSLT